jgi:hypothetical protein
MVMQQQTLANYAIICVKPVKTQHQISVLVVKLLMVYNFTFNLHRLDLVLLDVVLDIILIIINAINVITNVDCVTDILIIHVQQFLLVNYYKLLMDNLLLLVNLINIKYKISAYALIVRQVVLHVHKILMELYNVLLVLLDFCCNIINAF